MPHSPQSRSVFIFDSRQVRHSSPEARTRVSKMKSNSFLWIYNKWGGDGIMPEGKPERLSIRAHTAHALGGKRLSHRLFSSLGPVTCNIHSVLRVPVLTAETKVPLCCTCTQLHLSTWPWRAFYFKNKCCCVWFVSKRNGSTSTPEDKRKSQLFFSFSWLRLISTDIRSILFKRAPDKEANSRYCSTVKRPKVFNLQTYRIM